MQTTSTPGTGQPHSDGRSPAKHAGYSAKRGKMLQMRTSYNGLLTAAIHNSALAFTQASSVKLQMMVRDDWHHFHVCHCIEDA